MGQGLYLYVDDKTFKVGLALSDGGVSPESDTGGDKPHTRAITLTAEAHPPTIVPKGFRIERPHPGEPICYLHKSSDSQQLVLTNSDVSENGELTVHIIDVRNFNLQNFIQSFISPRISVLGKLLDRGDQALCFEGLAEGDEIGSSYGAIYWLDKPDISRGPGSLLHADPDFLLKKELDYIYQLLNALERCVHDKYAERIVHDIKKFAQTQNQVMIRGADNMDRKVLNTRARYLMKVLEGLGDENNYRDGRTVPNIYELLKVDSLSELAVLLKQTGLALVVDEANTSEPDINEIEELMTRVILNLTSNATDHAGGSLPHVQFKREDNCLVVVVSDRGAPITGHVLEGIRKGETTTTRPENQKGGNGYQIIRDMINKMTQAGYKASLTQVYLDDDKAVIDGIFGEGEISATQRQTGGEIVPVKYRKSLVLTVTRAV